MCHTNLSAIHKSKFSGKHLFFSIFITPHSVLTFCLPRNLLFVYPLNTEISFLFTQLLHYCTVHYQAGTNRTKATKRRRCNVCGSCGHVYGDFFYWRRVRKLSMQGYMLFRLKTSSRTTMEERRRFSEFIEIIYFLGNHYH